MCVCVWGGGGVGSAYTSMIWTLFSVFVLFLLFKLPAIRCDSSLDMESKRSR